MCDYSGWIPAMVTGSDRRAARRIARTLAGTAATPPGLRSGLDRRVVPSAAAVRLESSESRRPGLCLC